jgi:hypothetical protein
MEESERRYTSLGGALLRAKAKTGIHVLAVSIQIVSKTMLTI